MTAPNPPVGAVALDASGRIIAAAAHERVGGPHAEAKLLEMCFEKDLLKQIHTLVVTLEPCNHQGRTGPCSEAIIRSGVQCVVFGAKDPNTRVAGDGAGRLRKAGIQVIEGVLKSECEFLIRSFKHWVTSGWPWVTIKIARNREGSMIPPLGQKTFTAAESLLLAHKLRKRADAILTGSGTVLADNPEFTVRNVPDHVGKTRWLVLMDRRRRVPDKWIKSLETKGFMVQRPESIVDGLKFLGEKGCLEVLVEAGPTLSQEVLDSGLWNEKVTIQQGAPGGADRVETTFQK